MSSKIDMLTLFSFKLVFICRSSYVDSLFKMNDFPYDKITMMNFLLDHS